MRTETIVVYKFNELSDDAKEKARQWYRDTACTLSRTVNVSQSRLKGCKHENV